jgi:hypothetical protein
LKLRPFAPSHPADKNLVAMPEMIAARTEGEKRLTDFVPHMGRRYAN